MDYSEVITKAARLVWKFKILWLFGLLAGLGSGSGNINPLFSFNASDSLFRNTNLSQPFAQFFSYLADMVRQTPGWFFFIIVVLVCGLGLVFFLVGVFGKTGLTRGAWQADGGAAHLEFGPLVNESMPSFWRVAGLNLLVGLPGFAIALIFIMFFVFGLAASFSQEAPGIAIVLMCVILPLSCLLVPFFWFLGILSELSTAAVVGEGRGVIDGLKRGWRLIRRSPGPVLLVAVLVLVAQIGLGILGGLVIAPFGIGALLVSTIFSGHGTLSMGLLLPFVLIAIPLSLVLGAVFSSYIGTLWVLVFRRLAAADSAQVPVSAPPPAYPTVSQSGEPPSL